jgi:hypothetical protein
MGEFCSNATCCVGWSGWSCDCDISFGWCGGFIGTNGQVGVIGVSWAIAHHVPLELASEALTLLGKLGSFFQSKFLELSGIGGIDVHRDMIWI